MVATQNDVHIERIFPDHDYYYMSSLLQKLATFFRDYDEPYINNRKQNLQSSEPASHKLDSGTKKSVTG